MSIDDPRLRARDRARQLHADLRAHPDHERLAPAIELAAHLERAIEAFHMEAIRFRTYSLDRMLQGEAGLGADPGDGARRLFDEMRQALEAAGFHTRSHHASST